ncbi:MAG: dihydrolipoyllysine-residue acetyltransferase [Gemmatimonadetes bacterium]|nr:MAG: dihydrolipoyllysine-residue acetyltransferase [Gemmatimonadota bacterium]
MVTEFRLPELGENIESADIVKIFVSPGDHIEVDQPILEIETDKATLEVPSTVSGTITALHVNENDSVEVGQLILTVEPAENPSAAATAESPQPEAPPSPNTEETPKAPAPSQQPASSPPANIPQQAPQTIEFYLPELGENVVSGDVVGVLVQVGDKVEVDQPVLEIETDKATLEVPSPASGVVKSLHIQEGETVHVGQLLLVMESLNIPEDTAEPAPGFVPPPPAESKKPSVPVYEPPQPEKVIYPKPPELPVERKSSGFDPTRKLAPAAPSTRGFARKLGVDINKVPGTGPGGRISILDVQNYVKQMSKKFEALKESGGPLPGVAMEPLPDFTKWGEIRREAMNNVRKKTASHLSYAWTTIPHVTNHDKADITQVEKLRKKYGERAKAAGGKLTMTAILLKIVASALKAFPKVNASLDMEHHEIIYKAYYHIGVAVDTERGLLVPVIKNVDQKSIIELAVELTELSQKARDRKLSLDEMQGGTFSISNLGGIGGTYFTPIVNPPEVAILGVSRATIEPVFVEGDFQPRLMMPLSLSYDHRLIDGADAARFLRWIVEALEQPFLLALEG